MRMKHVFLELNEINSRPKPFQFYTAEELWTDEHTSKKMLEYHLNESVGLASRRMDFISRSAEWIVSHFGVGADTSIADFGCGPGLYTILFAITDADVTGIDFSGNSIDYAKRMAEHKGLNIKYVHMNYLEFETGDRFDLITMIFCDFCALSPDQRKVLLGKFHSFLKPGGSLLLDVHTLNAFDSRDEIATYERNLLDHFWSSEGYYGFLNTFKYQEEKVTLDKYTIVEKDRTRIIYNWLQYFSRDSIREELEENGFEVVEVYSDVAGSVYSPESPDIAVVARVKGEPCMECCDV
jgi:SAM-dependent methyltransferase